MRLNIINLIIYFFYEETIFIDVYRSIVRYVLWL